MENIPGLQQPNIRHLIPSPVDDVLRNVYDNLVFLRARVLAAQTATVKTSIPSVAASSTSSVPATMVDTHAVRLTANSAVLPIIGTTFYEIDRNAFYIVAKDLAGVTGWSLLVAVMTAVLTSRPTDLAIRDAGFIFIDSATQIFYVWTGTAWMALRAAALVQQGTYATRPAVAAIDNGLLYYATDQNCTYIVEAGVWVWFGGVMSGTIIPDTRPALAAGDVGFLFYGTDDFQMYRWGGAAWAYLIPDASMTVRGVVTTLLASGVYTPAITNVLNIAASSAYQCQYMRVGSVVTVSGMVNIDPTAAGAAQLGIALPIASNFGALEDCGGVAFCPLVAGMGAAIYADAAANRAQMEWVAVDTSSRDMWFSFTYRII